MLAVTAEFCCHSGGGCRSWISATAMVAATAGFAATAEVAVADAKALVIQLNYFCVYCPTFLTT